MVKFRQKNYTIQEGHFTGEKDMNKVPSTLEVLGKSTLGGTVLGGIAGKVINDPAFNGAITGSEIGFLGGVAAKLLLNHFHTPMKSVKYNEVDKAIRREFGVYKMSGVTVGDSIDKRADISEKFSFNDRDVTDYKLNFSIQDDKVTMYTFGMSEEELKKTSNILDYYTQKYTGMDYTSILINKNVNAYGVIITFTNYQIISNFMMELSKTLETKINILNDKALVSGRIRNYDYGKKADVDMNAEQPTQENSMHKPTFGSSEIKFKNQKIFSDNLELNKYDAMKILGTSGYSSIKMLGSYGINPVTISYTLMKVLTNTTEKLAGIDLVKSGAAAPRKCFDNNYLKDTLTKLHYINGFNYTVRNKNATTNISMLNGNFVITVKVDSEDQKLIDEKYYNSMKSKINKNIINGKVVVYTYPIESREKFEFLLKKLFSTKISFNVFE